MKNADDDIFWPMSGDDRAFYRKVEEEVAVAKRQIVDGENEAETNKRVKDWVLSQLERIQKEVREEHLRAIGLNNASQPPKLEGEELLEDATGDSSPKT